MALQFNRKALVMNGREIIQALHAAGFTPEPIALPYVELLRRPR